MNNELLNITNKVIKDTITTYFEPIAHFESWFKNLFNVPKNKGKGQLVYSEEFYYADMKAKSKDETAFDEEGIFSTSKTNYNAFENTSILAKKKIVLDKFLINFDKILKDNKRLENKNIADVRVFFKNQLNDKLESKDYFENMTKDELDSIIKVLDRITYHESLIDSLQYKETSSLIEDLSNVYSTIFKFILLNFSVKKQELRYGIVPTWQKVQANPYTISLTEDSNGIEKVFVE